MFKIKQANTFEIINKKLNELIYNIYMKLHSLNEKRMK